MTARFCFGNAYVVWEKFGRWAIGECDWAKDFAMSALPESDNSRAIVPPQTAASVIGAALETIRPHQWLKNLLVFIPLAAAHRPGEREILGSAACTFVAFSLCASSIYVFNDLHDAPADRLHPHKRHRPIASGALPRSIAIGLVPALLAGAMAACYPLGPGVAAILASYVALMVAYSLKFKAIVLLDALVLAVGYALRTVAGGAAVDLRPSPQLLEFCVLIFFSLALLKRYAELVPPAGARRAQSPCPRLSARGSGGDTGAWQWQRNPLPTRAGPIHGDCPCRASCQPP